MFTSQKFSQALKEAGFEGKAKLYWLDFFGNGNYLRTDDIKIDVLVNYRKEIKANDCIPSYDIIYDLCITYAKEVWGEERLCGCCQYVDSVCGCDEEEKAIIGFSYNIHSVSVFEMLQQGKSQDDIEDYIKTHSVLFNNQP